jgi:predicted GIY-YIG superfamily endonuclease
MRANLERQQEEMKQRQAMRKESAHVSLEERQALMRRESSRSRFFLKPSPEEQAHDATARRIASRREFGLFYIYALADPRTGTPYYVGRTANPARRLVMHWSGDGLEKKRAITSEIRAAGLKPVMVILERVGSMTAAIAAERKWINSFDDLTNAQCYDAIPFYSRTLRRSTLRTSLTPRR